MQDTSGHSKKTTPMDTKRTDTNEASKEKEKGTTSEVDVVEGLGLGSSRNKRPKKNKSAIKLKTQRLAPYTDSTASTSASNQGPLTSDEWPALTPSKAQKRGYVTVKPELQDRTDFMQSFPPLESPKTTLREWELGPSTSKHNQGVGGSTDIQKVSETIWEPTPSTSGTTTLDISMKKLTTSDEFPALPSTSASNLWWQVARAQETKSTMLAPEKKNQEPSRPKRTLSNISLFEIPPKILSGKSVVPQTLTKVLVNYLPMEIQPIKIYRYDVTTTPCRPLSVVRSACNEVLKKFKKIPLGFDQRKNLYTLNMLPGISLQQRVSFLVDVTDADKEEIKVEVSFKYTGTVDLSTLVDYMRNGSSAMHMPSEAIQAVDIILQQGTVDSYIRVGRKYFRRPRNPLDLREGYEMWTGLFQSAIFTSRAFINIDIAHKVFAKHQSLIDIFVRDYNLNPSCRVEDQSGRAMSAFQNFIKNLKVVAQVGKNNIEREFVINKLVDPPHQAVFTMHKSDGKRVKMTVHQYFTNELKCRIRYPNINCVWVGPQNKNIFYPMEFLTVSFGQAICRPLSDTLQTKIINNSATTPGARKIKINEVIKDMNYSKSPLFKQFSFDISNNFLAVDAKVLKAPRLDVGGEAVQPRGGTWMASKILKPQTVDKWGFLAVNTQFNKYESVIKTFVDVANRMGMKLKKPNLIQLTLQITEMERWLKLAQENGLRFVVVVISCRGFNYYSRLKRAAECDIGIVTQCVKESTLRDKQSETLIRNIILKINAKLMGTNHALDSRCVPVCLSKEKVMIVGADVTHHTPDEKSVPSIAAVTASVDSRFTLYNLTLSVQEPKQELILDLEDMMVEQLTEFEKRQHELPTKIYMFRDGVSEGQFAQLLNLELKAIYRAYERKVGPCGSPPEVLFVLVQKRHHTRLFFSDFPNNVEPGTVIDTEIVHLNQLDFYLVSHSVTRGTLRPTHYHVLRNDGNIPAAEVEQLTYYLCHLLARCQNSVSYPTPTFYAHLACVRARVLIEKEYPKDELKRSQRLKVSDKLIHDSCMFFA